MESKALIPNLTKPAWYVIYSPLGYGEPKHVYSLEVSLKRLGVQLSYPCIELPGEDIEEDLPVLTPLFPGYAFIHCIWSPGLERDIKEAYINPIKILKKEITIPSSNGNRKKFSIEYIPAEISPELLEEIYALGRKLEQDVKYKHEILDAIRPGDYVRFRKGAFAEFIGTVVRSLSSKLVIVEISLLGRQVQLSVDIKSVERI